MAAERIDPPRPGDAARRRYDLDVRTPDEYACGHIAGALNVPIDMLPKSMDGLGDGPVITTCSMGGRGGRAAELLDTAGRTAFTIEGGTKAWQAAGLPIATGPRRPDSQSVTSASRRSIDSRMPYSMPFCTAISSASTHGNTDRVVIRVRPPRSS